MTEEQGAVAGPAPLQAQQGIQMDEAAIAKIRRAALELGQMVARDIRASVGSGALPRIELFGKWTAEGLTYTDEGPILREARLRRYVKERLQHLQPSIEQRCREARKYGSLVEAMGAAADSMDVLGSPSDVAGAFLARLVARGLVCPVSEWC